MKKFFNSILKNKKRIINTKNIIILTCFLILWTIVVLFSENIDLIDGKKPENFSNFVSDGCSMFPDWDYVECCIEHDRAYFMWWEWEERLKADEIFYNCIQAKWEIYHQALAPSMFIWVRLWGSPVYPTPYRWWYWRDLEN